MTWKCQQEGLWICDVLPSLAAWIVWVGSMGSTGTRQCEGQVFHSPWRGEWAKVNSICLGKFLYRWVWFAATVGFKFDIAVFCYPMLSIYLKYLSLENVEYLRMAFREIRFKWLHFSSQYRRLRILEMQVWATGRFLCLLGIIMALLKILTWPRSVCFSS